MSGSRLSRRLFLGAVGASAALLPLLNQNQTKAGSAKYPTRLLLIYWTNGVNHDSFFTTGSNPQPWDFGPNKPPIADITTGFTKPANLVPLSAFEPKLIVPCGVGLRVNYDRPQGPVGGHDTMSFVWTGTDALPGIPVDGAAAPISAAGGPSIDQHIASKLSAPTKLPTLPLAAMVQNNNFTQGRTIWSARGQPVAPNEDPSDVFGQLFGSQTLSHADIARLQAHQKSVLDHAAKQLINYQSASSGEDRQKIEAHLDSVRQLEKQLLAGPTSQACDVPRQGARLDPQNVNNYDVVVRAQLDLIVNAFKCDVTRIATFQFGNSANQQITFPWLKDLGLGLESLNHHTVAHWDSPNSGDSAALRQQRKIAVDTWHVAQLADLLTKMDAVQEGDGTLLDHSVVVMMNGMHDGGVHDSDPLPIIMAGGANGYFRTGRYVIMGDVAGNQNGAKRDSRELLVSLCEAMGVEAPTFDGKTFGLLPNVKA